MYDELDLFGPKACSELELFSKENHTNVNLSKAKQMFLGSVLMTAPNQDLALHIAGREIEKVHQFKLLGVIVNDNLTSGDHINYTCPIINQHLYFLNYYFLITDIWSVRTITAVAVTCHSTYFQHN
jgi:hypothetical protein